MRCGEEQCGQAFEADTEYRRLGSPLRVQDGERVARPLLDRRWVR